MTKSQIRKYAFIKSIPIMCSYIFVSIDYGIMMEDAGFKWYYSLLVSMTVYTGAFQFVLITFLSSGASVITAVSYTHLISGIIKNYMLRLFAGEQFVLPDYQRAMLVKAGLSVPFIDEVEEKIHG